MKIAIVGTGISGNLVARLLADEHDVCVFEAGDYVGGHTHSHDIKVLERRYIVDTGFMVCNDRTYPNFLRMLDLLEVPIRESEMSFSVRCDRTGLEYQGSSLDGLFAQRMNLLRPSFHGMLRDILRFNSKAVELLDRQPHDRRQHQITLREFLRKHRFGDRFVHHYLVPMGAAIWSASSDRLLDFPATFIIRFFDNHGLLQVRDRPRWRTVIGGAKSYVEKLVAPFRDRIRLSCPVVSVRRHADFVEVATDHGELNRFDQVVMATHADQTLRILADADQAEQQILNGFPYQKNDVVLHTDTSLLPRRRRAWASWNYHISADRTRPVAVTYDLNRLQGLNAPTPICATLNPTQRVDDSTILRRMTYHHPAFGRASLAAQQRHAEISGKRRTHFCGAYWGYGFHEDGVNSALAVGRYFGKGLEECTAASTKAKSGITATDRLNTGFVTVST